MNTWLVIIADLVEGKLRGQYYEVWLILLLKSGSIFCGVMLTGYWMFVTDAYSTAVGC
jgi:hypothetical protein